MRTVMIIIALLTIVLIFILPAGQTVYTLQSEKSGYENVVAWLKNDKKTDQPIPVYGDNIRLAKKSIPFETAEPFYSSESPFWGTIKWINTSENPTLDIRWYDSEGQEIGTFYQKLDYDLPRPMYHVNPITKNLIVIDFINHVKIINPEGSILKTFTIRPEYHYNSENVISAELIDNTLFIATTEISTNSEDAAVYNSYVRIIGLNGKTEMAYDLASWQVRSAKASKSGDYYAVSFYKRNADDQTFDFQTLVFNHNGEVIDRIPVRFRQAFFSNNDHRLLLMDKEICYFRDILSGITIGKFTVTHPENLFLSATFLGSGDKLAIQEGKLISGIPGSLTAWAYTNIQTRTFDQKGTEIDNRLLANAKIFTPALWYNEDSQTLFVGYSSGWQLYQVNN